mmetsp:Transcript_13134/g.28935  ORF Transcript_13134/g.28935 Transcript_13134/m.28935 type:complete len:113 (-) Transcript_13134:546-884(-)
MIYAVIFSLEYARRKWCIVNLVRRRDLHVLISYSFQNIIFSGKFPRDVRDRRFEMHASIVPRSNENVPTFSLIQPHLPRKYGINSGGPSSSSSSSGSYLRYAAANSATLSKK